QATVIEVVVGLQVEKAVARVVEEDHALLARLLRRERFVDNRPDRVAGLGGGDLPLGASELRRRFDRLALRVRHRVHAAGPPEPRTTSGRVSPAGASCCLASSPMTVWCSSTWLSTDPSE